VTTTRRSFLAAAACGLPVASVFAQEPRTGDPLPSWNDGDAKKSVLAFVTKVTKEGAPDFVPVPERIAVFDNDGTLWPENPLPFQLAFAFDSLKREAPKNPKWKDDPFVKTALDGGAPALLADHHKGLFHILGLTHAGMTTDEFTARVENWLKTAKHPRFGKRYDECVYKPMIEVLTHLRANGFKTFIVSGGGADFMRVWTERAYGIPPEQVIGSYAQTKFEMRAGKPVLVKTTEHVFVDDKEGKPVAIHQFIGRRPVMCFGNSDGDKAMLEYTTIGNPRPGFGLIVHHTDAEREYAYDAKPKSSGKLVEALADAPKRGWTVVDMKKDWKTVFPFDK
jgi:phosphoglycolate phosphatase-like HAD superfamily hydrolase